MKKYMKPEMTVVDLKHKTQLLVGSVCTVNNDYYEDDEQLQFIPLIQRAVPLFQERLF